MTLTLRPELARFIDEQVKAGHYPTAEAVVEAALADMVTGQPPADALDEEDWAAIAEADAEFDRGEGMSREAFRAELARRFGTRP